MKKIITIILVFSIFCAQTISFATNSIEEQIEEKNKENAQLKGDLNDLVQEIEDIEKEKSDTLKYIEKLDKKVEIIDASLDKTKSKLDELENQVKLESEKYGVVCQNMNRQYDTMKKRIKYMYEHGEDQYLEILFGSKDFSELVNRAEYVSQISSYDSQMYNKYKKLSAEVLAQKEILEKKYAKVGSLHKEYEAKKTLCEKAKAKKKKQLDDYDKDVKKKEKHAKGLKKEIESNEKEVEKLLEQKAKAAENDDAIDVDNTGSNLRWPLNVKGRLSSGFGPRRAPTAGASTYHKGQDIGVAYKTPIVASAAGKVVVARYSSSAGNFVMINHGKKLFTVYMHCSRLACKEGDKVQKGDVIGYVGSTGILLFCKLNDVQFFTLFDAKIA